METPKIPQNEAARLKTLRSLNILDTSAEDRFDRLTRMASRMFDVPIALVSLVDENRQWFKSIVGLGAQETPRDISFCGHAILGDDVFVVEDTTQDGRFKDNPLVSNDPRIRFYAGCPLKALNGATLGTLCIIDQKPRKLEVGDLEALQDLAAMAEREIGAIELATFDELTHIYNRRGFLLLAEQALSLCVREKIATSLVFFDLNKFKPINDQFGHAEGDRALLAFASRLKGALRISDYVARIGGDEFVALLPNVSQKAAEIVTEKFMRSLADYNREANRGYDLSCSYGVIEYDPLKHKTVEDLLAEGDKLMYRKKNADRAEALKPGADDKPKLLFS